MYVSRVTLQWWPLLECISYWLITCLVYIKKDVLLACLDNPAAIGDHMIAWERIAFFLSPLRFSAVQIETAPKNQEGFSSPPNSNRNCFSCCAVGSFMKNCCTASRTLLITSCSASSLPEVNPGVSSPKKHWLAQGGGGGGMRSGWGHKQ